MAVTDRRRVLHVPDGVRQAQGLHHHAAGPLQGPPQRGGAQPAGRAGRGTQPAHQSRGGGRWGGRGDGHLPGPAEKGPQHHWRQTVALHRPGPGPRGEQGPDTIDSKISVTPKGVRKSELQHSVMKFDRNNKFDFCYYEQVYSRVGTKIASEHLWGYHLFCCFIGGSFGPLSALLHIFPVLTRYLLSNIIS